MIELTTLDNYKALQKELFLLVYKTEEELFLRALKDDWADEAE